MDRTNELTHYLFGRACEHSNFLLLFKLCSETDTFAELECIVFYKIASLYYVICIT